MAQVGDGPMFNVDGDGNASQNADQNPNQVANQIPNPIPNQVPDQNIPPLNHFLPNAQITPGVQPRPQ